MCGVGRVLSFSAIEVRCGSSLSVYGVSGCDVVFLRRDGRKLGSNFDRAVGRREAWSRVVDRAQAQQAVDLVQAALDILYLPLSVLDVILAILDAFAKLFGLLARKRDRSVVCCHILVV